MGKKDKSKPAPAADTAADIDDIFAAPKPAKPAKAEKAAAKDKPSKSDKPEKKAKAAKAEGGDRGDSKKKDKEGKKRKSEPAEDAPKKKKSSERVVEEVVDPSLAVKAAVEKAKVASKAKVAAKGAKGREVEEDMAFRDSRGDAGRKRTEEGFLVFKEVELGIDPEAGGTPLCPFDCECCF